MKRDARAGESPMKGMSYTAGQAARATGVSTATITRALKSGRISGKKDESGSWAIDPAELHRVFPAVSGKGPESRFMKDHATPEETGGISAMEREVRILRAALDDAREDRDRWRDMAERLSLAGPQGPTSPGPSRRSWWPWRR